MADSDDRPVREFRRLANARRQPLRYGACEALRLDSVRAAHGEVGGRCAPSPDRSLGGLGVALAAG